jgi:hypothetical protein
MDKVSLEKHGQKNHGFNGTNRMVDQDVHKKGD